MRRARRRVAFVLACGVAAGSVLARPAGARPAPAPSASAVPSPSPSPREQLREIGHVTVTAEPSFCSAFARHFNAAVDPILRSDERIGAVDYTLGLLDEHFHEMGGDIKLYDDRVHMMAYVHDVQGGVVAAQRQVDLLRRDVPLARDPGARAAALAAVAALQKTVDVQRQIEFDALGVVQALTEMSVGGGGLATVLQGGYDPYRDSTPAAEHDIRDYLKMDRRLDRIGDTEATAAVHATAIEGGC